MTGDTDKRISAANCGSMEGLIIGEPCVALVAISSFSSINPPLHNYRTPVSRGGTLGLQPLFPPFGVDPQRSG